MKVRDVIDRLSEMDPDRTVVIPTAKSKTARECCEVKEVTMDITDEDDFIPLNDERKSVGQMTVVALVPLPNREENKPDGASAGG